MAGRDKYRKGQYGMAPLSEKWIGFCLGARNRKGIGQVRSGKVFWFSAASNRKHHGRCYAWSSLMAFVFPRLPCVFCCTPLFFFFSAVSVHSHEALLALMS